MGMTLIPYAYSVYFGYRNTPVFPTCDDVIRYLIKEGPSPSECYYKNPVLAHVAGHDDPMEYSISNYLEQRPVDEVKIREELAAAVTRSRAEYNKQWLNGRTGPRFSGDYMLCECRPEELERMVQEEIARRSWHWKEILL